LWRGFGKADEREVAVKREAAQVAGAEGQRDEAAGFAVDMAELAGAGAEQPQPIAVPTRRVRHRQAGDEGLAGGDLGRADRSDVRRSGIPDRQSVEVTAVLGGEPAEERRAPERPEAVRLRERRQAAKEGVDEHQPPVCVDGEVVDVEVAGGVADLWYVEAVVAVLLFAGGKDVLEAPDLVEAAEVEAVGGAAQAHAAVEAALDDRQLAIGLEADQEEFADLVGGQRERELLLAEPGGELGRGAHGATLAYCHYRINGSKLLPRGFLVGHPLRRWIRVKAASAQKESLRREAVKLRHQFAQGSRGIFSGVLPASKVAEVIREECEAWRDRVYSPATTLRLFIGQVLGDDRACQDVLSRFLAERTAEGVAAIGLNTGAYCQARQRLPLEVPDRLYREVAHALEEKLPKEWSWRGRRVKVFDGTTVSMPDTPQNQKEFPQNSEQQATVFQVKRF
jgi:hypothetical protein